MEHRLAAFCELGMKYNKCLLEMNSAQLLFNTDHNQKKEYTVEALMQYIMNRLDEILNMLARDNMMRKKNKKCTFPLPKLNPRSHPVSNMDEAQEFRRALHDEISGILEIAFKPQEEVDMEIALIYDGSDIPDDTEGRRPRNNDKRNPPLEPTTAGSTNTTNTMRATEKSQFTINFDDRQHH